MKKSLFILPVFLLVFSAFGQDEKFRIEVEGNSEILVAPDEAILQLNLSEKAMSTADVTNALNKKTKSIQDALKKSGVVDYDFHVDNYYISVNRIYTKGASKDSGYVATQHVKVRVKNLEKDMVKVVETLHQTTDMGFNVQFGISDKQRKSYERDLLEKAIQDAKNKAEIIAKTLGIEKITVANVNYTSGQNNFQPIMARAKVAMAMDMAEAYQEPVFSPEEQKLTDRVLVSFAFEPEM